MSQLQSPRPGVIRASDEYINALSDYHGDTTTKSDIGSLRFQLLLYHPLVANLLKKFRDLPPEEIGLCLKSSDGSEGVFAAWAVDARGDKGQVKRMIVTLGVDWEGKRHVAWEHQPRRFGERCWSHREAIRRKTSNSPKYLRTMIQRELEHRGVGTPGFESKLIAWVEAMK